LCWGMTQVLINLGWAILIHKFMADMDAADDGIVWGFDLSGSFRDPVSKVLHVWFGISVTALVCAVVVTVCELMPSHPVTVAIGSPAWVFLMLLALASFIPVGVLTGFILADHDGGAAVGIGLGASFCALAAVVASCCAMCSFIGAKQKQTRKPPLHV